MFVGLRKLSTIIRGATVRKGLRLMADRFMDLSLYTRTLGYKPVYKKDSTGVGRSVKV